MSKELHYSKDRHKRVKETAEVFTPTELVQKMLDDLDIDWENPPKDKTFLDPTVGSGQFLVELAKRGIPAKNLYGVDIMPDNIETCKKRLQNVLGDDSETLYWIDRNIVQGDALTFDYEGYWE